MGTQHQKDWLRIRNDASSEDLFLTNCATARGVGLWAADLMGLKGDQATDYAHALMVDFVAPGPFDMVQRLQTDFRAKGIAVSEHRIVAVMERQREDARRRIALRIWSKKPGDGGWERRVYPRVIVPPMVVPPTLEQWRDRHKELTGGER